MGVNKAHLKPWGPAGPSLLEHAVGLLRPLTWRCVVSCAQGQKYAGYACIEDARTGLGPAQGLLACLETALQDGLDAVLVLGCDQPGLTGGLLKKLVGAFANAPAGTLATLFLNQATGKFEMLVAIYSTAFIPLLAAGLESGQHSLFQMLPKSRTLSLPYSGEDAPLFANLNTPAQFQDFSNAVGRNPNHF